MKKSFITTILIIFITFVVGQTLTNAPIETLLWEEPIASIIISALVFELALIVVGGILAVLASIIIVSGARGSKAGLVLVITILLSLPAYVYTLVFLGNILPFFPQFSTLTAWLMCLVIIFVDFLINSPRKE